MPAMPDGLSLGTRFSLHGYPAVFVGARLVPLRLKRALALIAYLSQQSRPAGREAVAALLWPDSPPTVARARLRRLVHECQSIVGVPLFDGDGDSLWLAAGWTSDVLETQTAMKRLSAAGSPNADADADADADAVATLTSAFAVRILYGFGLDCEPFQEWLEAWRRAHSSAVLEALGRAAALAIAAGDAKTAERVGAALLAHDHSSEAGHLACIESCALQGDLAGVEDAYFECARMMRSEFGLGPSARVEAAYAKASVALGARSLTIRYAPTPSGTVAYARWGQGQTPMLCFWGGANNLELALDEHHTRRFLNRLSQHQQVVMFDRRGTGVAERVGIVPDSDSAVEDIRSVMDHLGAPRAWLFGARIGGVFAIDFALRYPQRTAGIILYATSPTGQWSEDWPWFMKPQDYREWIELLSDPSRSDESLRRCAPSVADDPLVRNWFARVIRNSISPEGRSAIMRAYEKMDLRHRLSEVKVPTLVMHRRGDRIVPFEAGRQLARAIPGAEFVPLEGEDSFFWFGDCEPVHQAVRRFTAPADAQRTAR